jgi:hypothetical protein
MARSITGSGIIQATSSGVRRTLFILPILIALACQRAEPITAQRATEILENYPKREPVYAAVPQKVWWDEKHPKDDFDEKSVATLRNLERGGYITVQEKTDNHGSIYTAKVTDKGFPLLGTGPSARGPVYKALICHKKYDGIRDFQRHPNEPTTGRAELIWHYDDPTPLYDLFETKIDKPLRKPFASLVSFYYKDHQWKFNVTVRKTNASSDEVPPETR